MQNKGAILTLAILFAAVCLYQLSFTWKAQQIEDRAAEYAQGDPQKEDFYLDSISGEVVYNFLGLKKFTYREVKELEINLGLDLKGGMNVTLEVSVRDLIRAMSNYSNDSTFVAALNRATEMQRESQEDFVTLFGRAFEEVDPNARLASIFNTLELRDRINFNTSNEEVLDVIRQETNAAIDNSFNILRTRIDRFGVAQPNIQQLQTKGRILVELPGVKDQNRVRNLLQGTAKLEFWETYENQEVYPYLLQANERIKNMQADGFMNTDDTDADTSDVQQESETEEVAEEGETADADTTESSLLQELEEGADTDTTVAGIENLQKEKMNNLRTFVSKKDLS